MKQIFLEDELQRNRDHISSLNNSERHIQIEFNKHLFALATVGFGYNLIIIFDNNLFGPLLYLWVATAIFLAATVVSCFLILSLMSEVTNIQSALAEFKVVEIKYPNKVFDTEYIENIENEEKRKIRWLNRFKRASAIAFSTGMLMIFIQAIALNLL